MKLSYKTFELKLRHTFRLSGSEKDSVPIVITSIEHDGIVGYGEASPSRRLGESVETVQRFLDRVDLHKFSDPFALNQIVLYLEGIGFGNGAAKASIDIALHDWIGKKLKTPLYKYWDFDKTKAPATSFTIGIDSSEVIAEKVTLARDFPILKIKLGTARDKEIIAAVRKVTNKPLRVDANEGWKTKEIALDRIKWLQNEGVELVEQPMPAADIQDCQWVRERVNIPIIADENSVTLRDLPMLRNAFDGVNIKLMKCGGLREALQLIYAAKAFGMKTMLGCMIESSVGITAAAHLSPLVDYADLDGNLLITNDPFDGVKVKNGRLILGDEPGLGVISVD